MENKIIYVPVSVQEELPDNDEWVSFYINNENLWVGKRHDSGWMFFCSDGFKSVPESEPVTHWLKRIELPSREEMNDTFKELSDLSSGVICINSMKIAREYILSIINQKK